MKKELEIIKENLEATLEGFKDAYETEGYDLGNERYYVETALKQVNLLLLHNVVGRSEQLVCPFCQSDDLFEFELKHSKCRKCKEQWTN